MRRRAWRLLEGDDAANPVLRLHELEAVVDLVQGEPVAQEGLDVDLAAEPTLDELGNLCPALDAAERRPRHPTPGDEEARDDVEGLPLARDADHGREAPRLARGLDGLAHHPHVPRRLERVVGAEAACLR